MLAFVLLLFSFVPNGNFICFKEYNRLCEILIDNDIQCHLVSNRIKTFNSACRKIANIPSESKKYIDMQSFNDIELSVEEEIINNMLPLTSNDASFPPNYKPTQEDLHDAAKL